MRYLLYGVVGLMALLVGAAAVGPAFVDWGRYKDDIAAAVHGATGRTLQINGDLDLSILPSPRLSASDVRFLTQPGSGRADVARLGALQVHVRLMPLLAGEIAVTSMTLVEPEVVFEIGKDGGTNWELPAPGGTGRRGDSGAGSAEPRAAGDVRLDGLRIANGSFVYRNLDTGIERRLESVNAEVFAGSLRGPFEFSGTLRFAGSPIDYSVSVGSVGENDAATVDIRLASMETGENELVLDAVMADIGNGPTVTGTFTGRSADIAKLISIATGSGERAFAAWRGQPLDFEARLSATPSDLALDEIAFNAAGVQGTGAVNVAWRENARVDAVLRVRTLNIDRLLGSISGDVREEQTVNGTGRSGRPDAFALPAGVTGSIDVAIDSATLLREHLREIKATATLGEGKLTIDQARARLPGGAEAWLSGILSSREGVPAFEGSIEGQGNNLRATLRWLGVEVGGIPRDRLGRFTIAAHAESLGELVRISDLDATFDATRIQGGVTYAIRERPSFGATLAVDRINLDAYLAADTADPGQKRAEAGGGDGGAGLAMLDEIDANVSLRVDRLTFRQTPVHGVRLNGTMMAGKLTVKEAAVRSLGGTALAVAGTVEGFTESPVFEGTFNAEAENAVGALRVLGLKPGPGVARLGAFKLSGKGEVIESMVELDAELTVAGAELGVKGGIKNLRDRPMLDVAVNAQHADVAALAATVTGGAPVRRSETRRVRLSGTVKGPMSAIDVAADVDIAGGNAAISGKVSSPAETVGIDVAISAEHPEFISLIRAFAPDYEPSADKTGPLRLAAHVKGTPEVLSFEQMEASIGPAILSGRGEIVLDGAKPSLKAVLVGSDLVVDPFLPSDRGGATGASADATDSDTSNGLSSPLSGFSRERLDLSILHALDAAVTLEAESLSAGTVRIDEPRIAATLDDRVLTVTRAEGMLYNGAASFNGTLDGTATPEISGKLTVRRADLQEALQRTAGFDFASGEVDLDLDLKGAGRSEHDIVAGLDGEGAIKGREGVIKGFNLDAISERLQDPNGKDDILTLISAGIDGGSTRFSEMEGTFTIEDGVVHTDDARVVAEAGVAEAEASVDLAKRAIEMDLQFRLSEHPGAPPFRMRLRGPWDDPRRYLDFQDLQTFLLRRKAEKLMEKVMPVTVEPAGEPGEPAVSKPPSPPPPTKKPERPGGIDPDEILKDLLQALPER